MTTVDFDNSNEMLCDAHHNIWQLKCMQASKYQTNINCVDKSSESGENCIFLFLIFRSNRAVLSCLFYAACQTKREKMEREKSRGKRGEDRREEERRGEGGWRTRDGGGADMHLSPISSNTFHNSSALSLLPRLRTISPDAH